MHPSTEFLGGERVSMQKLGKDGRFPAGARRGRDAAVGRGRPGAEIPHRTLATDTGPGNPTSAEPKPERIPGVHARLTRVILALEWSVTLKCGEHHSNKP